MRFRGPSRPQIEIVAAAAGVALVVKAGETCPGAEGFGPAMGGVPVLSTAQGPIARTVPILQYLAGVHAHSALHGDCLYTDAVVDQWLQVFLADIAPNLRILQDVAPDGTVAEGSAVAQAARGKPVAPKAGLALRSRAEAATAAVFAALAARLETHSCLVTERITLADIAVASQLLPLLESGAMPSVAPAIARWALACAHHADHALQHQPDHLRGLAEAAQVAQVAAVDCADGSLGRPQQRLYLAKLAFNGFLALGGFALPRLERERHFFKRVALCFGRALVFNQLRELLRSASLTVLELRTLGGKGHLELRNRLRRLVQLGQALSDVAVLLLEPGALLLQQPAKLFRKLQCVARRNRTKAAGSAARIRCHGGPRRLVKRQQQSQHRLTTRGPG